MILRELKIEDAKLMLEWMHDKNVIAFMQNNFINMGLDDCVQFIQSSYEDKYNIHKAIEDEDGNYLGTVSLKNIDYELYIAEFAITVRSCAMGKGISSLAMQEMLKIGFKDIGLQTIYWCVSKDNTRAIKFYDKNGYGRVAISDVPLKIKKKYSDEQNENFIWYNVINN